MPAEPSELTTATAHIDCDAFATALLSNLGTGVEGCSLGRRDWLAEIWGQIVALHGRYPRSLAHLKDE
jgi:hypothetical protein